MDKNLIRKFETATHIALKLHNVGRPGLLDKSDFRTLVNFQQEGWDIYRNSTGETRAISPYKDIIFIDPIENNISIRGSKKETF